MTILVPNNKAWFELMFKNGALPGYQRCKSPRCCGRRRPSCKAAGDRAGRLSCRSGPPKSDALRFFLRQAGDLGPMLLQHLWPCC